MKISPHDVPYLGSVPKDGRIRPLMTFFEHTTNEWSIYYPQEDDSIIQIKPIDCTTGIYLSKEPQDPNKDFEIPLLTFLFQRYPTEESFRAFDKLNSDLENGLALLEKHRILFIHYSQSSDMGYMDVIRTDVEYALFNHRSFYDLINRLMIAFLKKHTAGSNTPPDSFRKVAEKDADALAAKFHLPRPLIDFYKSQERQFMALRAVRDGIGHHGHSANTILKLDDGFGLSSHTGFAKRLIDSGIWAALHPRDNNIASCLGFLTFLTNDLFVALQSFTDSFIGSFRELPQETAPGHQVYSRMRFVRHYHDLAKTLDNPWNRDFYQAMPNRVPVTD